MNITTKIGKKVIKNIIKRKLIIIILLILENIITYDFLRKNKKRVCIINLMNLQNVGNILVKFSLYKKIKELGFHPTIVASVSSPEVNIDFLKRTTNLKVINKAFSELNEKNYDYIVVNSDQTWVYFDKKYFYDIAFLAFAKNWKIPKFIYGASIAHDKWFYTKEDEEVAKKLLKNFTGISFREKNLVRMAKKYLDINGVFVLDPTLLLDKKYYLNEIRYYHSKLKSTDKFIFIYQLDNNPILEEVVKESVKKFDFKIYKHNLNKDDYIESFIFGISKCQAVITDSFHGTVFSIKFNKPFLSFINRFRGKGRFDSLKEVFNLENRIIDTIYNNTIDINLLNTPLILNNTLYFELQNFSMNYLKRNLGL